MARIDADISWEKIVLLFYIAGKLAYKMVRVNPIACVPAILDCTLNFFKEKLLDWVSACGGWISSFSVLARVAMEMPSVSKLILLLGFFMAGIIVGSVVTYNSVFRNI